MLLESLRKFLRLPATERRLLIKAALLLEVIRVGLWLLPFRALRRLLVRATGVSLGLLGRTDQLSAERVAWAVEAASRRVPGRVKTCLTQAMTAQVLLIRRGHPALLHIGVVRSEEGEFEAHAWVESEGRVVIGGHELERYTPLTVLEGEMP